MTDKTYCDKCGKDITSSKHTYELDVYSNFKEEHVIKMDLCSACEKIVSKKIYE